MQTKHYFLTDEAIAKYPCLKPFHGIGLSEEYVDNAEGAIISIATDGQFIRLIESLEHALRHIENALYRDLPEFAYEAAYEEFEETLAGDAAQFALKLAYQFNPSLFK